MESNSSHENNINDFLAITNTSDRQMAIDFLLDSGNDLNVILNRIYLYP